MERRRRGGCMSYEAHVAFMTAGALAGVLLAFVVGIAIDWLIDTD